MIPAALLMAACYLGVSLIAGWRAYHQGTEAPELHHVLPVGAWCLVAFLGWIAFAYVVPKDVALLPEPALAMIVASAGMFGVLVTLAHAAPRMAAQPTTLTLHASRREAAKWRELHARWRAADVRHAEAGAYRVALAMCLKADHDPPGAQHVRR